MCDLLEKFLRSVPKALFQKQPEPLMEQGLPALLPCLFFIIDAISSLAFFHPLASVAAIDGSGPAHSSDLPWLHAAGGILRHMSAPSIPQCANIPITSTASIIGPHRGGHFPDG
ncbi:hypothetical protein [Herbaspirillum sp.]|uniref:hypothetical protein n=1 Tax=Herbaspirillum sp. TaxID=1890675 RepID=UPI001B15D6C1|nr:hypothetical protein [Herbaspirillum sp.]MBO9538723.1 hypothetical protein [Herbaspirillum sp.]